jgi:hypothetical protein
VKKHVKSHLDSCIFVRVEMGDCLYYFEADGLSVKSLYVDYAGDSIESSTDFPPTNTFILSTEKRNLLCEAALEDMIRMEVLMRKHPNRCEVQ